jgi:hypothetical protein
MLKSASIDIFRDLVSEYDAAYRSVSVLDVLSDAKELLGIWNDVMESTLDYKFINKEELKEAFLSDLALHYLQDPSTQDPVILALLSESAALFQPYLEEARLFSQAFARVQRKVNKRVLQEMEEELEAEELFHAFNRLQRKENKALLQAFEANERTGTYYSHKPSILDQHQTNNNPILDHTKQRNATQWVLRIAAILLLIAIPAGILRLYFMGDSNNGSTNTAENDPKKPQSSSDYFASTYVDINLPKPSEETSTVNAKTTTTAMGYANSEEAFNIKIINLQPQLSYLHKREKEIQSRITALKNKTFNHKKSTLDSLETAYAKVIDLTQYIQRKELTYEMNAPKLSVYVIKEKDLQQMKVFNYNDLGSDRFYLYSEGKYFSLNNGQGKLNAETDEGILSALDSKN